MKNNYVWILLILIIILISSCTQQTANEIQEICEIGKEYENNAVNSVNCECPDGYEFEIVSMSFGPCPQKGMTDCPASIVKCIIKSG